MHVSINTGKPLPREQGFNGKGPIGSRGSEILRERALVCDWQAAYDYQRVALT